MNTNPKEIPALSATRVKIGDGAAEAALGERFAKAFQFLHRPDLLRLPTGRYVIDGERMFATVSDNLLKPAGDIQRPEFHKRYADVQAPLTGEETIGLPSLPPEAATGPFDAEKDIAFFEAACPLVTLSPGECLVIPPMVAHAPCLTEDLGVMQRKVVIKVEW